jgi:phage terminase small subunit
MKLLNAKEQRFVDEYLLDLDPKRAAIAAGYSETTAATKAYQWVANGDLKPNVFNAIAEAKEKRSKRTEIRQDWVLQTLVETIDRCRQSTPVVDKDGNPVFVELPSGEVAPAYQFAPAAVLRGLELAGKHLGMFKDRKEVELNVFDRLSFEDKEALLAMLDALDSEDEKAKAGEEDTLH